MTKAIKFILLWVLGTIFVLCALHLLSIPLMTWKIAAGLALWFLVTNLFCDAIAVLTGRKE